MNTPMALGQRSFCRMRASLRRWLAVLPLLWIVPGLSIAADAGTAPGPDELGPTIVHLLDYVAVDYPATVKDGKVTDEAEYQEQLEFVTQSVALLGQLPAEPDRAALLDQARTLHSRIEGKAAGGEVARLADALRWEVIRVYRIAVTPKQAPDLRGAAHLFEAQCAACHGPRGRGDGPQAKGMDPAPANFHDDARMRARSAYGLYNTITLGVAGTPMRAFKELSDEDRWALALFVSSLRARPEQLGQGETLWKQGQGRREFGSLKDLVTRSPAEIAAKYGEPLATVQAWLATHPQAIQAAAPSPLALTRGKLDQTLQRYRQGEREAARQLAISAYLEGFELVESSLDNVDSALRVEIEREMMSLRSAIGEGKGEDEVAARVARIGTLLDQAEAKLEAGGLSPATAFFSSLLILLREGLEAILVLAAIVAFVRKTGRRDALAYVHVGWIAALALGALTWILASQLITISGAQRELTEGITGLIASAMLLYVGYWLHTKSYAQAWTSFIREQVTAALGRRTLWAMAGVSFLAVYRELFEIILFYETLWVQAGAEGHGAVLGGIGVAAVALVLLAWAILRYSVRLPIGAFFAATAWLLALLAVVFAGNGVAALQEAGVLQANPIRFVSIPLLGVHPTLQGVAAQAAALALVMLGLMLARRAARPRSSPP